MTKQQVKAKCERIAREIGAELTWIKGHHGYYIPGTNKIAVGQSGSARTVASIFSHELGHYQNFLNKKYWKYHSLRGRAFMKKFKTKDAVVTYALKAELYTDKVGKRNCAKYFPGIKYRRGYRNNQTYYNMMYQKYFGGFFIVLLERF